jgi:hypothetical protein
LSIAPALIRVVVLTRIIGDLLTTLLSEKLCSNKSAFSNAPSNEHFLNAPDVV